MNENSRSTVLVPNTSSAFRARSMTPRAASRRGSSRRDTRLLLLSELGISRRSEDGSAALRPHRGTRAAGCGLGIHTGWLWNSAGASFFACSVRAEGVPCASLLAYVKSLIHAKAAGRHVWWYAPSSFLGCHRLVIFAALNDTRRMSSPFVARLRADPRRALESYNRAPCTAR